jgi:hypothetical protein
MTAAPARDDKFQALLAFVKELAPRINALPKEDQMPVFEAEMADFNAHWDREHGSQQ